MQTLFTSKEVAELLHCECRTVEDHLRSGNLPGIKIGSGWIIPSEALNQRLNQLALEEAEKRRSGRYSRPLAIQMKPPEPNRGRRRGPPTLPLL